MTNLKKFVTESNQIERKGAMAVVILKNKKIIFSFICAFTVLCFCAGCVFASDAEILKVFDFDSVSSISEYTEFSGTSNSTRGVSSFIKDGAFAIGKHTPDGASAATHTMYVNLADYIGENVTYTVKLDLVPSFASGKNFIMRCGANIQLASKGNGKFVVQRMVDGAFKTENAYEFSFADADTGIAFSVKNKQYVDVYYCKGDNITLIYGNLDYIENSSTKAGTLGFTFNKTSDGDILMDNIILTNSALRLPDITRLEFQNIGESFTADMGETLNIPIIAEANSGISKIDIYFDDELEQTLTQEPYMLTLQDIDKESLSITAKAVSNDGDERKISFTVNFVSGDNAFTVFEDFEFNEGDSNILDSGISMYPRRGYVKTDVIDAEHGDSLLVGVDEPSENYTSADIPYIDIPLKESTGRINIEYDLYVDTVESSGKKTMVLRLNNDKETNIVRFTGSEMKVLNKLVTTYEEHKWYHFLIKADTVKNTVSVFVDGTPLLCDEVLHSTNSDGNLGLKLLRLYGPGEENLGYTAIDNIRVTGFYDLPTITSCDYNGDNEITVKLSSKVYESSINEKTVSVKNAKGRYVDIKSVYYDDAMSSIIISTAKKLVPSSRYTVVISENAMIADGVAFGENVTGEFLTDADVILVSGSNIKTSDGLCKAEVSIKNTSDSEVTVYVVMALFKGSKGEKMRIAPVLLNNGESKTAFLQAELNGADCAQIYIYSDVMASKLLSSEIIKKNF